MTNENAQRLFEQAHAGLQEDLNNIQQRTADASLPDVQKFVNLVLEWRTDPNQKQLLWEMFEEAFSTQDLLTFFGTFNSFVSNCLLANSCFAVEWRKPDYDLSGTESREIQYLPDGCVKTILTTKEDPDSSAHVIWAHDEHPGHCSDAKVLIEAMEFMKQRNAEYMERMLKLEEEITHLSNLLQGP